MFDTYGVVLILQDNYDSSKIEFYELFSEKELQKMQKEHNKERYPLC